MEDIAHTRSIHSSFLSFFIETLGIYQGCSLAMTRPAGRVNDTARGSGQDVFESLRVESAGVRRYSKPHGSDRVGSGGFQISRVGSSHLDPSRPPRSDPTHDKLSKFSWARYFTVACVW